MMLEGLLRASVDGAIVAALVWVAIRCLPRLSPATRTALWWCAAAKFVLALVWVTPVELRVLPAESNVAQVVSRLAAPSTMAVEAGKPAPASSVEPSRARGVAVNWSAILVALWIAGLVAGATVDLRRFRRTRAALRRSSPAGGDTAALAAALSQSMGLRRVPVVRLSDDVATPLVTGLLRPHILLPSNDAAPLSEDEQRMALCHEISHVKRADLWLGLVPAAAERLFFFHPLVRLSAREYSLCREAACDAAVIGTLATSPQDYGRLLLTLGVPRHRAGLAIAGASSSHSMLKRRIAMLRDSSPSTTRRRLISVLVIAAALAAVVPLRLVARTQAPADAAPTTATTRPAPAWAGADWSRLWLGPGRAWLSGRSFESLLPGEERTQRSKDLNYVLFLDDHNTNMSGSLADIDRARKYRRGNERLLWFRHNGGEYVIRDAKLIDQMLEIWRPVGEIGDAQGELGTKQGALGTKQGELGTQQGVFGTQQGVLGTRQGQLGMRQGMLHEREQKARTDAERRAIHDEARKIDEESRSLEEEMRALEDKMHQLDAPMRDLQKEMDALDVEMKALDRKMEGASNRAEGEMRALIERAIGSGAAERVK